MRLTWAEPARPRAQRSKELPQTELILIKHNLQRRLQFGKIQIVNNLPPSLRQSDEVQTINLNRKDRQPSKQHHGKKNAGMSDCCTEKDRHVKEGGFRSCATVMASQRKGEARDKIHPKQNYTTRKIYKYQRFRSIHMRLLLPTNKIKLAHNNSFFQALILLQQTLSGKNMKLRRVLILKAGNRNARIKLIQYVKKTTLGGLKTSIRFAGTINL